MGSRKQYAALPFVWGPDGPRYCLITSRDTGRWIIPKGWPDEDLSPRALAAEEAYEEAGLKGTIGKKAVGSFRYNKRLGGGRKVACKVDVYPLLVDYQAIDWPEQDERTLRWVSAKRAEKLVDDDGLSVVLRRFDKLVASKKYRQQLREG